MKLVTLFAAVMALAPLCIHVGSAQAAEANRQYFPADGGGAPRTSPSL